MEKTIKVKASYAKIGMAPYEPNNFNISGYSKTIEVPEGSDMEEVKEAAIEDAKEGYNFIELEVKELVK